MRGKAKQGEPRRREATQTRQGKARKDKAWQPKGETRQGKTDKVRRSEAKQGKERQFEAREDNARQSRRWHKARKSNNQSEPNSFLHATQNCLIPQLGDLKLPGPPSGQDAGGGASNCVQRFSERSLARPFQCWSRPLNCEGQSLCSQCCSFTKRWFDLRLLGPA
ncbi:hypothetical protein PoB_005641100 [Plakobranchus ocellatus]|uniref:Uncharacterized protein n=1 Tax=Plakobranchus ocellatus TaxID=259542 RepID=A0AAV4C3I1_9GAST|nr:hypothetical protein PoB_005641100 [Plakobranchus ocellatus]